MAPDPRLRGASVRPEERTPSVGVMALAGRAEGSKVGRAVRVYMATEPVNLRKSFDGLTNEIRMVLERDPLSGHVFASLNRRRTQVKLMLWEVRRALAPSLRFRVVVPPRRGAPPCSTSATDRSGFQEWRVRRAGEVAIRPG